MTDGFKGFRKQESTDDRVTETGLRTETKD